MMEKLKYNFSFAGCGFLGIYHVGVTTCLKKYAPHLVVDKVSGASAGALAALLLLSDVPFDASLQVLLKVATAARSKTLGPFSPSFNLGKLLGDALERILPEDVHLRVNGRLHISMTRVHDRKNVIHSDFSSREEVKQAILCATFIPFFSGLIPPTFRGVRYMDGGFTDNCPMANEHTITVTPYAGESDICPNDGQLSSHVVNILNTSFEISTRNMFRLSGTFFPPSPTLFYDICQQGFDDALRFLAQRDLIGCSACVQPPPAPISLSPELDEITTKNYNLIMAEVSCHDCKEEKKSAMEDSLPEPVQKVLQDFIDSGNRGLINKLYSYRGVKFLSVMTLPWSLSADIAVATGQKIIDTAPSLLASRIVPLRQSIIPLFDTKRLSSSIFSRRRAGKIPETVYLINEPPMELQIEVPLTEEFVDIESQKDFPPPIFMNRIDNNSEFEVPIQVPIIEEDAFNAFLQRTHPNDIVSSYYSYAH